MQGFGFVADMLGDSGFFKTSGQSRPCFHKYWCPQEALGFRV